MGEDKVVVTEQHAFENRIESKLSAHRGNFGLTNFQCNATKQIALSQLNVVSQLKSVSRKHR